MESKRQSIQASIPAMASARHSNFSVMLNRFWGESEAGCRDPCVFVEVCASPRLFAGVRRAGWINWNVKGSSSAPVCCKGFTADVHHFSIVLFLGLSPCNKYFFPTAIFPSTALLFTREVVPFDLPSVYFTRIFAATKSQANNYAISQLIIVYIRNLQIHLKIYFNQSCTAWC